MMIEKQSPIEIDYNIFQLIKTTKSEVSNSKVNRYNIVKMKTIKCKYIISKVSLQSYNPLKYNDEFPQKK